MSVEFGIYVGRFCPMHLGHQVQIERLLQDFGDDHLLLLGSCNHSTSFRHLFSYRDRREFIRMIFQKIKIIPLPDFDNDTEWFQALDDIIQTMTGRDPITEVTYIGGCQEDIEFFVKAGRHCRILNRFAELPNISATQVRDALIEGRPIEGMVDPRLVAPIKERFGIRWSELRKR